MTVKEEGVPPRRVTGRAARIMLWILRHQERINALDKGSTRADFGGESLVCRLETIDEFTVTTDID